MPLPVGKKVEAKVLDVVFITVKGEKRPDGRLPDDGGLVRLLLSFLDEKKVSPVHTLVVGGGMYAALFWPQDRPVVCEWLTQNGIEWFDSVPEWEAPPAPTDL